MTPRKLSHFELLDELGAGGMGVVFRARDLRLNRLVAVKVLPAAAQGDAERRRFLAEAQAASGINHPAVVTIHEVDSDAGVDFIAMELVEGRSLAAELRRGPLPLARALRIAVAVADGLDAAHRLGLVHRDLKPGNLMLGAGDRVKILDFGLVKRVEASGEIAADAPTAIAPESLTASGLVVGTPAYMSPEQARGEPVDARSDLFALGCVLYEMLTGRRAFAGDNPVQVLSGVLTGEPPPVDGVPPALRGLLARLLAKRSGERPASAADVRSELEAISSGAGGEAAPTVIEPAPALGRRRTTAFVAVALAAVAVAAAVYLAWPRAAPPDFEFRLLSEPPGEERQASFSPDAAAVAFVREDDAGTPQIWIRSLAGGEPLQLTRGDTAVGWPDWSAQGDRIVFARASGGIWEIPPLGGTPRRLLDHGSRPRLSTDGRKLVFISREQLWTAAGDGSGAQPLPGLDPVQFAMHANAVFSPDGEWIACFFPDRLRPLGDLWRIPATGGTPERLTELEFFGGGLDWSPDGRWIVFSSDHQGSRTLWRIPAEGGEPEPITRGAGEDSQPRLSRDGRRLVYTNQRNLYRIEALDPATGRQRTLYERRNSIFLPRLSHAGDRIAFFARVPGGAQVFVLGVDSGHVEPVTFGERAMSTHPRWSSDDRALDFYRERPDPGIQRLDLETGRVEPFLPGWLWSEQQYLAVAPGGRTVAYLQRESGRAVATRVRDVATGTEHDLPVALYGLDWLPDGRRLVGSTLDREGRVQLCDAVDRTCREVTAGEYPRPSPDGETLYFLRFPGPSAWRHDLDGGREERLAGLAGEFHAIDFYWGVRPNGEIVWVRSESGREELWVGEQR